MFTKQGIHFFQSFSEINTEGGDCTLLCCKSVTRKHWKFEAVTNMAIVSPVFWGVQSWSLLEVYRRVVVTCCWAEDIGIFFKTVGKCLKNYTAPNTLLYFKTVISNRLRISNKITCLVDTCLWWPELTDLELNSNYMGVISCPIILRKYFLFLVQWYTIHTKR